MTTKVMVVDAHPVYAEKTVGFLGTMGLKNISRVSSGEEAVQRLAVDNPDIVVLSAVLPDMDGLDVVKAALAQSRPAGIVVQAGVLTGQAQTAAFEALPGVRVVARKEKDWSQFEAAVTQLLR